MRCSHGKWLLWEAALVCFLFGIVGESEGSEYFVAPDGLDANPGTQPAPFRTIQKAAGIMVAGDTCRIRAGTYLTNHRNALDKPGEWHWQDNTLHLWPPDGKDPSPHLVEAKKRHLAFDLRGRDYVTLKGLRIFASSVTMYNANHCVVDACRMSFVSHYTWFDDNRDGYIDDFKVQNGNGAPQRGEVGVYVGGKNNVIQNSVIKYSAGAGLILGGYRTTVTNSIIHDCGYVGTYLGCIFITYDPEANWKDPRGGHAITRNELYRSGRSLINVQSHPSPDVKKPDVYEAMGIGYNRGHDGAVTANDGGGFFYCWRTTLGTGESRTQIHHNLIWDVWGCDMNALVY